MFKRFLCLMLAVMLLLSLFPAVVLPSLAASNMKTSEACIQILKEMEGFSQYAYYDHSHYSIGYGSTCKKGEYPNGITEEEADALLREYLVGVEEDLNSFADRHQLRFSQNQFDALILFTYNVGGGWLFSDGDFRQAVIENKLGNSFIYPFSLWSNAGGEISTGLVNRRLIEANMYLNGSYANVRPDNYTWIVYDNNGGEGEAKVQGYDYNLEAYVQSLPERETYTFLGWYTAAEGGAWVTELTSANARQTLYAHWQAAGVVGTPVSYEISAAKLASLEVFDGPNGEKISSLNQDSVVYVQADHVDAEDMKWGRISNGRWVMLGDPRVGTGTEIQEEIGVKATVTGDYVNVRRGPGTNYDVIATVQMDDTIVVSQTYYVEDVLWGKFRAGWLCLEYTDYSGGLTPEESISDIPASPVTPENPTTPAEPEAPAVSTVSGTVTATQLNVRAVAGTHGKLVGSYSKGDRVTILETTTVSGTAWGRTDKGWICMTYVKLEKPQEETTTPTEPETTVPEEPEQAQGTMAKVISKSGLNIRSGPGTKYSCVGSYASGEQIRILEQKVLDGIAWGRTDKGWVCMQYLKVSDSWTNENGIYGVVISGSGLNIRAGAGVGHAPVGSYPTGARILVFEQVVVSGTKWGRTDKGWVCMDYVRLGDSAEAPTEPETTVPETTEPETTVPETTVPETTVPETTVPETTVPETTVPETTEPETTVPPTEEPEKEPVEDTKYVTGTVIAGGLNVRKTPGPTGEVIDGYRKGDRVTILEQKQVNSTTWGRTDKGWISLAYVRLDAGSDDQEGAVIRGIITASSLCIRTGPGTGNAVIGTYLRGQAVTILETTKVGATTWGRTDLGWICMDYVK